MVVVVPVVVESVVVESVVVELVVVELVVVLVGPQKMMWLIVLSPSSNAPVPFESAQTV